MRMSFLVGCGLLFLLGCSAEAGSSAGQAAQSASAAVSGAGASSAVTDKDREAVIAFFEGVGDRTAAALKKVADSKPMSRIAYAEPLLLSTPAAFPAHSDLFDKHGLTLDRFTVVMADPKVEERALAALRAKIEPLQKELAAQSLPETDPEDCTALARRLIELRNAGPNKAPIANALAPSFVSCATVVPAHVSACLPTPAKPSTLQEFDACVAKGAPAPK